MKHSMMTAKIKHLTLTALLFVGVTAGADCEKHKDLRSLAQEFIRVSTAGQVKGESSGKSNESLKSIAELARGNDSSEQVEQALAASKSLVSVDEVLLGGRNIEELPGDYVGSGFVAYSQCHVFTARHVPNEYEWITVGGERVQLPKSTPPLGYTVKMTLGYGPGSVSEKIEGTVIAAGASALTAHTDYAVIRLKKRTKVQPLDLIAATEVDLVGAPMVSLGFPYDAQTAGGQLKAFAAMNCTGVGHPSEKSQNLGGQPTTCSASPGVSGGPTMAKVKMADGTQKWKAVGINSFGRGQSAKNGTKSSVITPQADDLRIVRFDGIKQELIREIEADLKANPCQ